MFLIDRSFYKIKKVKKQGLGIYATKNIEGGMVIGDYIGRILYDNEADELEKTSRFYSMFYTDETSIFPDLKSDGIHLINHSCMPNCAIYPFKGHMLYFSLRKIFKGEEFSLSYNIEGPETTDETNFPCFCNTVLCKGTFCISIEKSKKIDKFINSKQKKYTKDFKQLINKELPLLDSYPKSVNDNKIYDIFSNLKEKEEEYKDTILPSIMKLRQLIRTTGKRLYFPNIGIKIIGISNNLIIAQE